MLKIVLTGAVAAGALLAVSASARAADPYTFALVPKNTNNPFFDQALAGCKKAEKELAGAVKCLYIGPGEHGGGDEQAQIVADLVTKKVDGIAVSAANAPAIANALKDAAANKIPVLTWDSDLLPEDKGLRAAYVGTHNYDIGVNIAKLVMQIKPKGGTICIQSGGAAAANHNERMQGIRDTLAGAKSAESPGASPDRPERLEGSRRLPALHERRLHRRQPADGGHPRQISEPRRVHADRRLPAVPAGRLCEDGQRSTRTRSPPERSRSWSPTRCRFRSN